MEANKYQARRVYCYETDTVYSGVNEAARAIGCTGAAVTQACKGVNRTAGRMHVCYEEDMETKLSDVQAWLTKSKHYNPIHAQNIETGEELEFDSATEAARALGISNSGISQVIHGRIDKFHGWTFW